jgi:aminobenzoyl-glutamate utilization protein B
MPVKRLPVALLAATIAWTAAAWGQELEALKQEVQVQVDDRAKLAQEIVDSLFSFAELGFQEVETQRYLTGILRDNGFTIEEGVAGIPTAWVATWGTGKPIISLNSDVDGLPDMSQKPGVAYRAPIVEGAPGHGEGHNSGIAISIVSALAVKEIMERDGIAGTLQIWPGIAEEQLATKQYIVAAGVLDDVDVMISNHVSDRFGTAYGASNTMAMVSVEFTFHGVSAHGAVNPWEGRSALDAVELMNAGWNARREHLRPEQRSHYVITDGGAQPNVVPPVASVWYYFRETSAANVVENLAIADDMAAGAALMTGTEVERRLLGSAWPHHYNEPVAKALDRNIEAVGMPEWSADDVALAEAVQTLRGSEVEGLRTEVTPLGLPVEEVGSGPSDDIGAVTWTVPSVRLSYPSNIPGAGIHNWTAAIAMATPIAHKGVVAGAKATAMTTLDLLLTPDLVAQARDYFDDVQTRDVEYVPFEGPDDAPATMLNAETQADFREALSAFYYDPDQYETYLDQLGVTYPDLGPADGGGAEDAAE